MQPCVARAGPRALDSARVQTTMDLFNRLEAALASNLDAHGVKDEIARLRERVASEQRAATAHAELLEAIVEAAPVAMMLLDDLGTIVFTNHEARELFFEAKRPEGANFLRLLSDVPEALRRALLSESDHIFSVASEGASEIYHLARRPASIGGAPHLVLIVRNMTSEISRQENAVLRKAIRVIHHEFANSIAPVRSLLQSVRSKLSEGGWSSKLEQTLGVIEERVLHLSSFLTGFAALGRLPTPRPQEVVWDTFLGRLAPLLSDIAIGASPAGRGWFDPAQIEQVIINLVKNARESGCAASDIQLEVRAVPEGGYRASVCDRGQGMSDEVLDNAMVPSFTTKPSGSGMGLTLCREIIDAHRGRLRIARRDGGGIAVSFWLPPRDAPAGSGTSSRGALTLTRS
jgi:two-component system nitrogen regulation sensor histidine kinase NtrY